MEWMFESRAPAPKFVAFAPKNRDDGFPKVWTLIVPMERVHELRAGDDGYFVFVSDVSAKEFARSKIEVDYENFKAVAKQLGYKYTEDEKE